LKEKPNQKLNQKLKKKQSNQLFKEKKVDIKEEDVDVVHAAEEVENSKIDQEFKEIISLIIKRK
jgi:disulfide oxidoreductase YuzD